MHSSSVMAILMSHQFDNVRKNISKALKDIVLKIDAAAVLFPFQKFDKIQSSPADT